MMLNDQLQNAREALADAEAAARSATERLATAPDAQDALRNAATAARRVAELKADLRELDKAVELAEAYKKSAEYVSHITAMKTAEEATEPVMTQLVTSASGLDAALANLSQAFADYRAAWDACAKQTGEFHSCAMTAIGFDQNMLESVGDVSLSLSNHLMQAVSSGFQRALIGMDAVSSHIVFSDWLTHAGAPQLSCEKAVKQYRHRFETNSKTLLKRVVAE
jgi:DNA repair exonuclease SbcCD ATPase subunit